MFASWYLILASMVNSNADLPLLLKRSFAFLPPSLAGEAARAIENMKPPSPATLSRYQLVLDASYCRHWHDRWWRLLSNVGGAPFAIYASCDSSPQIGQDFEIMECRIVSDPVATWKLCQYLRTLLPVDLSKDSLLKWSASLTREEVKELKTGSAQMLSNVERHVFTPCVVGSRHSNLANKFHCMLHALKFDIGNWDGVRLFLQSLEALTTDQGTERLLADVPSTWREVEESGFLPKMKDCLEWNPGSAWNPRPRPHMRGEKRLIEEVDCAEEPAAKKSRASGAAVVIEETQAMANIQVGDSVMDVDSDTDDDMPSLSNVDPDFRDICGFCAPAVTCSHPGCGLEVFGCCIHCGLEVCHLHIGPMTCGFGDHPPSRCHEHLGVPIGQRSLVPSLLGLLRCPCQECIAARDGVHCPCNAEICRGQVCMCVYVPTHTRMHAHTIARTYVRMYACMCLYVCMYVSCMYVCVYVCMCVCIYVCMYD